MSDDLESLTDEQLMARAQEAMERDVRNLCQLLCVFVELRTRLHECRFHGKEGGDAIEKGITECVGKIEQFVLSMMRSLLPL